MCAERPTMYDVLSKVYKVQKQTGQQTKRKGLPNSDLSSWSVVLLC